jgi:hypothetical protein
LCHAKDVFLLLNRQLLCSGRSSRSQTWPSAQHAHSPRCALCSFERVTLPGQSAPWPHQRCPSTPQMLIVGNTVQAAPVPAHGIDRPLASLDPASTASLRIIYHAGSSTVEHFRCPRSPSHYRAKSRHQRQNHGRSLPRRMTLLSPISRQSNSSDSLRRPNGGARRHRDPHEA